MSSISKQKYYFTSIPPNLRTAEDIQNIFEEIQNIAFLKNNFQDDGSLLKDCCKYLVFEEFPPDSVVIHIGDIAEKFYIVLSGNLSVFVPLITETNGQVVTTEKEVKQYTDGDYFGELSLISGSNRKATIRSNSDCLLAVITKKHFQKSLSQFTSQKIDEKVSFLKKLPMFDSVKSGELQKLSYFFNEIKVFKNQCLFQETASADKLYLIRHGDFKVLKNTKNVFRESLGKKGNSMKNLQLAIKSDNEVLGYEELVEKHSEYQNSCYCISNMGVLLVISFNDFRQRVRFPICWKFLTEICSASKLTYENRLQKLRSVEDLKDEFTIKKSKLSLTARTSHLNILKKYSPGRDIFYSPICLSGQLRSLYHPIKLKSGIAK